ncbi:probable glutamate receptor [Homarus americanus]|uniref:probable glutamate receptor n=1 Tax=Homarus americanus TaxID=6706 RepID=UPI001C4658A8|nr:probable glutamate receptor [Homarus americanus]
MTAGAASLLLVLTVSLTVAQLPRPQGAGETLSVAGAAVAATVWRPRCSVILLTDGTTSSTTVFTELGGLGAPWGVTVFQVAAEGKSPNMTEALLSRLVAQARRVRQVSWCVTVVVVSDDSAFLAASAEWIFKGRLLVWTNRLLAVTRRPLSHLRHLHTSFSMMNAMLLLLDDTSDYPRCSVYVHLPYSSQVLQVASWAPHLGLSLTTNIPLFPEKFDRFLQRPALKVTGEEFPPHVKLRETGNPPGPRYQYSGAMIKVLELLAHSINFTYTIVRAPDGSFGNKLPDGTWTGMVGMVGRKEVDLGLGPFGISAVRTEVVDYTVPIMSDYLRILGGRGKPEVDPWGFLLPLAPAVWAVMLASLVLLLTTVLLLSFCFSVRVPMLSMYFRVLLQENTWVSSDRWWERMVLGGWMIVMLVLTLSYSGNLMSLLAVRYIPQPFQFLRDLLEDPSTTMIWEYNTVYVSHFRTSTSGALREVRDAEGEERIDFVLATEYPTMLDQLVRKGPYVYVGEDLTIKVLMAQDFSNTGQCDFYTSREAFMPFLYCMIGSKNSPLVPAVSKRITWITEAGLYDHWMKSQDKNSTVCVRPPTKITVRTSLSLSNIWGMFVVFAGGNSLGLVVLCLELLTARL